MDPKETMSLISQYLAESNYEEAFYSLLDLEKWAKSSEDISSCVLCVKSANMAQERDDLLIWIKLMKRFVKHFSVSIFI